MIENSKKGKIRVIDVVFMNIVGLLGIRWFATAGQYGASSIVLWIIAAFLYFVPMSFIFAEFSTVFPDAKGGFVDWVRYILGDKVAFYSSWYYFVQNIFYYPTILTFAAICMAYPISTKLADSKLYTTIFVLTFIWICTFINIKGLNVIAIFAKIGGLIGNIIPIITLIILALVAVIFLKKPVPTDYSFSAWLPHLNLKNLLFISTLTFAMAGGEITSPFAINMKNPKKDYAKATLISAFFIALCYIIGTVSLTLVLAPKNIGAGNGIIAVLYMASKNIGAAWIASFVAVMITLAGISGCSIWMIGCVKMFIYGNEKKYIPAMLRKNNKNDVPANAMIVQSVIVSVIVLATSLMRSVNDIYIVLVVMTTIQLFIVYVIILLAYLKLKFKLQMEDGDRYRGAFEMPFGKFGAFIAFFIAMSSTLGTLLFPVISPPCSGKCMLYYEIEVIGGPILFWLIATYFVNRAYKKKIEA